MSAQDPIDAAFEAARRDFLKSLEDRDVYNFSQFTSINHVYDATEKIQEEQRKSGTLRALTRIQPYLNCLSQYVGVIDTFAQAKPDILCLIWGPIKLFLQISSTLIKCFDQVVEVLAEVSQCLPQFQKYAELFQTNQHIKEVLCLFYRDILDFHATILNFFRKNRKYSVSIFEWKLFFEALWPRSANKISVIQSNIIRHKDLMNSEVTLESVLLAYKAREAAYQEYEKMHQFQDWQNFEVVRSAISPYLYDNDLEAFGRDCQTGSGQWLEDEDNFKKWSDINDHSVRLFWLQGIPGAGKTVVSSFVIRRKRAAGHTVLFAFPRHNHPTYSSALKILHSLIFQIVLDNQPLQQILNEAYMFNSRGVMGSLEFTTQLFTDLIKESGPIFIIIDGADEMAESEWQPLLKILAGQLKACEDLKLLVSSRQERDIALSLGDVPSARVDHKNFTDIEEYVRKKTDDWLPKLQSYGADDSMCSKIEALLESISSKAKGMFLYVKLVMSNIMSQDNLYDIQTEMGTLPVGIDQAYARILARIEHNSNSNERLIARKTMEWVGCADFPLRVEEILQALVITPGRRDFLRGRKAFRDILKLCGPIIEIENDVVQFVHFTAKEYIFGKQSNMFLNDVDGNLGLASVCLSYLTFECFNEALSPETIGSNILSGDYVLFTYAADAWLGHIRKCAPHLGPESVQSLHDIVSTFTEVRKNYFFQAGVKDHHATRSDFQSFQEWPNECRLLILMDSFMWKQRRSLLDQNDSDWVNQDPSTISSTRLRIRRYLEAMLCPSRMHAPGCPCKKLRSLYGHRLFKCDRFRCEYYRIGFDTRSDRDSHLRIHNRPFKCPEPNCEFADIGFISEKDLSRHRSKIHQYRLPVLNNSASDVAADQFTQDELRSILVDAISADEVEFVRSQFPRAKATYEFEDWGLVEAAAKTGSPPMVDFLLEEYASMYPKTSGIKNSALCHAIDGENMTVIKHLISRGADPNSSKFIITSALRKYNIDIIELLLSHGATLVEEPEIFYGLFFTKKRREESEIFEILHQMRKYVIGKKAFSLGFLCASYSGSIPLVKYFIDNGADVRDRDQIRDGMLYELVRKFTKRHAEVIKFLLQQGAEPYPSNRNKPRITSLVSMRKVEKYFGKSWDDLVRETIAEKARITKEG